MSDVIHGTKGDWAVIGNGSAEERVSECASVRVRAKGSDRRIYTITQHDIKEKSYCSSENSCGGHKSPGFWRNC